MNDNKTADVLDMFGDMAGVVAKTGGVTGLGALAVAAILKASAKAVREKGQSVEDILKGIREPRAIVLPWRDKNGDLPTAQETPLAKKGGTDEE